MNIAFGKVIRSRNVIEVYRYEHAVPLGGKGSGRKKKDEEKKGDSREMRKTTVTRIRNNIRRLVTCNFNQHDKFITLTFADEVPYDVTDINACNRAFKKFIQRLRYKLKTDFKYLAVIEFQDKNARGAVHYHMVASLPYLANHELANTWGQGFVRINDINDCDNVGAYIVKYMTWDTDDTRLVGQKAYLCSRNLDRPTVTNITNPRDRFLLDRTPIFENSYKSEFAGEVTYKEYNLKQSKRGETKRNDKKNDKNNK